MAAAKNRQQQKTRRNEGVAKHQKKKSVINGGEKYRQPGKRAANESMA